MVAHIQSFSQQSDGRTFAKVVKQPAKRSGLLDTYTISTDVELHSSCAPRSCTSKVISTKTLATTNTKPPYHSASIKSCISAHLPQPTKNDCIPTNNRFAILEEMSCIDTGDEQSCYNVDHADNIVPDHKDSLSNTDHIDSRNEIKSNGHVNKKVTAKGDEKNKEIYSV